MEKTILDLYQAVFDEFKKELERYMTEIFSHPLPFTQVNRLSMLAATVAQRCVAEQADETDAKSSAAYPQSVMMLVGK